MTMTLGEWLKKQKLSPETFGERIDVEGITIRRYLDGSRFPKPDIIVLIETETGGRVTANDFVRSWANARRTRKTRSECRA